jgi:folate-binding protein YgfZ
MLYLSPVHRVLRLSGPDALTFLQSQLTNDVAALAVGQWQWQGYCSAKGRLLATFALARIGDDAWEAVVPTGTIDALAKRLTMFRMRSKVVIEIAADRSVGWAFAPVDAATPAFSLSLPDGRAYLLLDGAGAATLPTADDAIQQRWQRASIEAMQPEITAATAEMFVPQMIGWDTVQPGGGVSFSKGCYPGQEIVARAHYRGAVKRHLEKHAITGAIDIKDGAEVTLTDGRTAEVCNAVRISEAEYLALVVVASLRADESGGD